MSQEPTHFAIRNWADYQHYSGRNPPWIKLHFKLLASEDWVMLDDASRVLAIACMLIASRDPDGLGRVPNKPDYVRRVAYLKRLPNFKPLIECGFLEIVQANASTMLAHASTMLAHASALQTSARPDTESDTDSELEDKKKETSIDVSKEKKSRGTRLPDDWRPSPGDIAFAETKGNNLAQIDLLAEHFIAHHQKTGDISKSWPASWRTWVLNDVRWHGDPQSRRPKVVKALFGGAML